MKIGIIGTGNMGTILVESLLDSGAVSPSHMIVTNRTKSKALRLTHTYEALTLADSNKEVFERTDLIFICVKPLDIYPLLIENKAAITKEKCIVSITSPVQVPWLEEIVPASCARVIPSITNRALAGITLFTFGESCEARWKKVLWELFSKVSTPLEIEESITRVASDIVSCGPAFFSYLTEQFIQAAISETKINEETATILAEQMFVGLGELLKKRYYSLPTLVDKVCVKGGITGEGIDVLEKGTGKMFHKLFRRTHDKFRDDAKKIEDQFFS